MPDHPGQVSSRRIHTGRIVKLDIDQAPAIAARYGVQGIPLLLMLKDGKEIDRVTGAVPARVLREVLGRHVAAQAGGAVS